MTTRNIQKLLAIAGGSLSPAVPALSRDILASAGRLSGELHTLLQIRNGFYALESALHVRPATDFANEVGLEKWNSDSLWRQAYKGLADGAFYFAEDIFGGQFCIAQGSICRFDPETGERETVAATIDEWARLVLVAADRMTGWSLGRRWQERHGPLEIGKRLIPKLPFVLGGEFSADNLHAVESIRGMRFYGDLAVQIHDAPDGTQIEFRVVE